MDQQMDQNGPIKIQNIIVYLHLKIKKSARDGTTFEKKAASDAIASKSNTWATLSNSVLGDLSSVALSAKHSRWHEIQADDYGYDFLRENGKNPWAMGLAFMKLKVLSKQKNTKKYQKLLDAFSSHPDFDERIERMRAKAENDGYICM